PIITTLGIKVSISETKAVELATNFIKEQRKQSDIPVAYETGLAILNRRKRGMSWITIVEEGQEYWSVYFDLNNDPAVATRDPNHIAVMVSTQSENIEWLSLL
ncbi:hypothetical protein, partial [Enterovibrio norvegicus]|uniref:hypothetical protein n=2 Tax=Enterovibrio norvegicus TaxID=188144 RepID=UPI001C616834